MADVRTVSVSLALLAVVSEVAVAVAVVLSVASRRSVRAARLGAALADTVAPSALRLAFAVATVATLGSLYYSEVANFPPCRLCWYQRIAMYPLVPILGLAALRGDLSVRRHALVLACIGAPISAWHVLVERFPGLEAGACDPANPCSLIWVDTFGYLTIPTMALSAFALIAVLLVVAGRVGAHVSTSPSGGRHGLAHGSGASAWPTRPAVVILLGLAAVVLAGLDLARTDQPRPPGPQRETGAVTVRGAALPPMPRDGAADPAVGRPAPALSGTDFDGRPVASAAGGDARVLIFLAHWCPHCRDEVPLITSWLEREDPPTGVTLTSVSTGVDGNRPNYPPSSWLRREGWPLPVLADDPSGAAAKAYGLTGFPFFVFVDADGTVAGRHAGTLGIEELKTRVDALRAGRRAPASTTAAAPPAVDVEMGEMWFRPATVQVPADRLVRLVFRNVGQVAHQALLGDAAEQEAAEARGGSGGPPGRTLTLDPGKAGELVLTVRRGTTLLLGCHLPGHWPAGMRGTVVAR